MEIQLQVDGRDLSKFGVSGETHTATKANVMVFGGHSGQGMLYAKEIATSKTASSITTVSKRGRPGAPGPARAFMEAMSQDTVHYMAACDVTDAKALECLADWAPPVQALEWGPLELEGGAAAGAEAAIEAVRRELPTMGPVELKRALQTLESAQFDIVSLSREVRSKLAHKGFAVEKESLQEQQLGLQEREASILELIADLTARLGAAAAE